MRIEATTDTLLVTVASANATKNETTTAVDSGTTSSAPRTSIPNVPGNMACFSGLYGPDGYLSRDLGSSQESAVTEQKPTSPESLADESPYDTSIPDPAPAASSAYPMTFVTPKQLPRLATQVKDAIASELKHEGLDPSKFRVSYWEEFVWYPGAGYVNKRVTIEAPDGRKEDFEANLTLRNPEISLSILMRKPADVSDAKNS